MPRGLLGPAQGYAVSRGRAARGGPGRAAGTGHRAFTAWMPHPCCSNAVPLSFVACEGSVRARERDFRHSGTARTKLQGVDAAFTSFQRHEGGIHVVSAGAGRAGGGGHGSRERGGNTGAPGVAAGRLDFTPHTPDWAFVRHWYREEGAMPAMKLTPIAAMRARDVSRPRAEHLAEAEEAEARNAAGRRPGPATPRRRPAAGRGRGRRARRRTAERRRTAGTSGRHGPGSRAGGGGAVPAERPLGKVQLGKVTLGRAWAAGPGRAGGPGSGGSGGGQGLRRGAGAQEGGRGGRSPDFS